MSSTIRFDNGDLEIDSTGGQQFITGAEKAAQDLLHELFMPYDSITDRGNEMFLPDGALTSIVGTVEVGSSAIRGYIMGAVRRLQRVQRRDPLVDRTEIIQRVRSLIVRPIKGDVTSYQFYLSVVVDDENISIARAIRMQHIGNTETPLVGGYDPA